MTGIFGNLGVHIIQFPSGRFGFVGTLPTILGDVVPATTADVMGGRASTNPHTGEVVTVKFPTFETCALATAFAAARGVTVTVKDAAYRAAADAAASVARESDAAILTPRYTTQALHRMGYQRAYGETASYRGAFANAFAKAWEARVTALNDAPEPRMCRDCGREIVEDPDAHRNPCECRDDDGD